MAASSLLLVTVALWFHRLSSADVIVLNEHNKTVRRFDAEPALFGPHLQKDGFAGHLMISDPIDACTVVHSVPANGTIWIALVKRQVCTFAKKVFNVQQAGYRAAIVYNVGSDDLIPMRGDGQSGPIIIPSVFVGESSGLALSDYRNCTIVLTDDGHSNSDSVIFLPFAIVLPLCTVIMCCFLCVRCAMDHVKKRRSRLSKSNLKKLPIKKFKKGCEYEVCAICLDEYEEGEKLRELPCAHAYHQKCIDPWLTKNKQTCPLCNKKVFPRDDDSDMENGNGENRSNENTPLLLSRNTTDTNYGLSTAQLNLLLDESDSDSTQSQDDRPPNRIESQAEIHPSPRNETTTTTSTGEGSTGQGSTSTGQGSTSTGQGSTSTGEVSTLTGGVPDLPTIVSSDSTVNHRNPSGAVDNEGFGFDEEYFGENRGGATGGEHSLDPLQVDIHGGRNFPVDGKSSDA